MTLVLNVTIFNEGGGGSGVFDIIQVVLQLRSRLILVRLCNHARVSSWNQPVLTDVQSAKLLSLMKDCLVSETVAMNIFRKEC